MGGLTSVLLHLGSLLHGSNWPDEIHTPPPVLVYGIPSPVFRSANQSSSEHQSAQKIHSMSSFSLLL